MTALKSRTSSCVKRLESKLIASSSQKLTLITRNGLIRKWWGCVIYCFTSSSWLIDFHAWFANYAKDEEKSRATANCRSRVLKKQSNFCSHLERLKIANFIFCWYFTKRNNKGRQTRELIMKSENLSRQLAAESLLISSSRTLNCHSYTGAYCPIRPVVFVSFSKITNPNPTQGHGRLKSANVVGVNSHSWHQMFLWS